jgi:hydroxylaminobenzene mutase
MQASNRQLMRHGMFLFLLGLVTGFLERRFANVRMGLAAHLEGVMNGTFLIALGAIWNEVRLSRVGKVAACGTVLYGTYGNWLTTTLAAIFGTAANTPIAAAGYTGRLWQESFIAAGFFSVAIAMVASAALVLWGLWEREAWDINRQREEIKSTMSPSGREV